MKKKIIFENNIEMRLDHFLTQQINLSKNYCQKLIASGNVLVNNKSVKKSYILKRNDCLDVFIIDNTVNNLEPFNLNLEIIYEDEFLAVINKPKNLVTHPSDSFKGITLVNGLLFQIDVLKKMEGLRPGIVHRLDKDTTGLILIAKTEFIRQKLQIAIQTKKIKRFYWALIHNHIENYGKINLPIGRNPHNRLKMAVIPNGKSAITYFKTLKYFDNFSLIECQLETGRTHQIRVHLSYIKHPILGDILYNLENNNIKIGQLLHAKKLEFIHPITDENISLEIDLPSEFKDTMNKIYNKIIL